MNYKRNNIVCICLSQLEREREQGRDLYNSHYFKRILLQPCFWNFLKCFLFSVHTVTLPKGQALLWCTDLKKMSLLPLTKTRYHGGDLFSNAWGLDAPLCGAFQHYATLCRTESHSRATTYIPPLSPNSDECTISIMLTVLYGLGVNIQALHENSDSWHRAP